MEQGPTDVAVFKVINFHDMKCNRTVRYGEPVWLAICFGKNKPHGHWTEGSILGAKADKGIFLPVVPLDPKKEIVGNEALETQHTVLGIPGPVNANLHVEGNDLAHMIDDLNNNQDAGEMGNNTDINKIAAQTGKFTFTPSTHEMQKMVREAAAKGEWVEVCNLNDCYLEQDFFILSRETPQSSACVLTQAEKIGASFTSPERNKQKKKSAEDDENPHSKGIFRIRLLESEHSKKHIGATQRMMQKAKEGVHQSLRRRMGEKVMYDVDDFLSNSKDVCFQANGGTFKAKGSFVSPIRGGGHFVADLRLRTYASVESNESSIFDELIDQRQVHARYGKIFKKIESASSTGALAAQRKIAPSSTFPSTKQRHIREMKVALPKLKPSKFKLKSKRIQNKETARMIKEKLEALDDIGMTREEYYEAMLQDIDVPLTTVKALLAQSTTMPTYSKLLKKDKDVKRILKKEASTGSEVVASIAATSSIENIIPMSRQGGKRSSPVGVPEIDVFGVGGGGGGGGEGGRRRNDDTSSATGSNFSASPATRSSPSNAPSSPVDFISLTKALALDTENVDSTARKKTRKGTFLRVADLQRLEAMRAEARKKRFFGEEWEGAGMEQVSDGA